MSPRKPGFYKVEASPEFWLASGYTGIGIASFLGGSILPLSSEIVVLTAAGAGMPWFWICMAAGLGNSVAVILNYWLGYKGLRLNQKWETAMEKQAEKIRKHGWLLLFLSWVPFVGDPITVAAGAIKIPFIRCMVIVLPLRWIRYFLILLPWILN